MTPFHFATFSRMKHKRNAIEDVATPMDNSEHESCFTQPVDVRTSVSDDGVNFSAFCLSSVCVLFT